MLSPKAAALSDRGFCQRSTIALPVPYVALIPSEGIVPSSNGTLHIVSLRVTARTNGEFQVRQVNRETHALSVRLIRVALPSVRAIAVCRRVIGGKLDAAIRLDNRSQRAESSDG